MIKDRINKLKEKVAKMKSCRGGSTVKKATIKFSPFSKKQKKVLTWWLPNSPVSDKDGIIADGAIRSGKTISMSLSYVVWTMVLMVKVLVCVVRRLDHLDVMFYFG